MNLSLKKNSLKIQLMAEAIFVCRLEQSRTQVPMNFDRGPDYPICQNVFSVHLVRLSPRSLCGLCDSAVG